MDSPVVAASVMLQAVTTGLTTVIGWVGTVVTALVGESGDLNELLPLLAIGVSIAVLGWSISAIRRIIWGA